MVGNLMFKQYHNFITDIEHVDILTQIVYQPRWQFGQTSDDTIEPNYPMWFQNFYNHKEFKFIENTPPIIETLANRFEELYPEDYMLVRVMASANTFGLDGDYHTDWPHPGVSFTGVLYTDKEWDRNWGGETLFAGDDQIIASEYEPCKLVTFDSSIPHIGKGPQRRCKEMRSILAFQAVQVDALKERLKIKVGKST
tara:strand:- start:8 stop:598 length:591 start_codon:yes stop_codon:yes gene_type:complete